MEINLSIDRENIEKDFLRIASELMNQWIFKVDTAEYRIAEIEFYFQSDFHNDGYTHGHMLQKERGRWYFHGSGVDLTFGSGDMFGGILIRAICDLKSGNYTYGPLNSLTEIFSNILSIYEIKLSFGLFPAEYGQLDFELPICAPRVGLNQEKDTGMFKNFYRFLIMPKQKHAEKTKIADTMRQQGFSVNDINKIWG